MTASPNLLDDPLADYTPVALAPRRNGWTAQRQRQFLTILAETGSISTAAHETQITARSAYRLRAHPAGKAFAAAWDEALVASTGRLLALAFERATQGIPREVWRGDKLVLQTRQPSDKLMMFLLAHLLPKRFAPALRLSSPGETAQHDLPGQLAELTDADLACEFVGAFDYDAEPPAPEIG